MATDYFTVRVKNGEHQGQHRVYHTGDVFRTQYPLHEMFVNKFELLPNAPAPIEGGPDTINTVRNAQSERNEATKVNEPAPQSPTPPAEITPYGEYSPYVPETFDFANAKNVTSQFKAAKSLGLEVWNSASDGYAVSEAGAKVPMNLAPSNLATKKEVKEYLDSMKGPELSD